MMNKACYYHYRSVCVNYEDYNYDDYTKEVKQVEKIMKQCKNNEFEEVFLTMMKNRKMIGRMGEELKYEIN